VNRLTRILAALIATGLVAVASGRATYAAFSVTTQNPNDSYVAGNVSAHGAFEQLRKDATQAVDDHFDGKRSQEIRDLGSFLTRVASLLAQNRSPCGSRELSCFSIDPGAATRLTQTAQAVIDAL